jgi:hypothetical protein
MLLHKLAIWLSISSTALAGAIPPSRVVVERQATSSSPVPDGACTNGPRTRNCWSDGFSIATDFDAKAPPAGKTVTVRYFNAVSFYADTLSTILKSQIPLPTRMELEKDWPWYVRVLMSWSVY